MGWKSIVDYVRVIPKLYYGGISMMKYPRQFLFVCDDEIHRKLKELAKRDSSSMGRIIRLLIERAYDDVVSSPNLD